MSERPTPEEVIAPQVGWTGARDALEALADAGYTVMPEAEIERLRKVLKAMIEHIEEAFSVPVGSGEAYIWTRELRDLLTTDGLAGLEERY